MQKLSRRNFIISMFAVLGYGKFWEPQWFEINEEKISIRNLSPSKPIVILHLSDLHSSKVVPIHFIDKAVELGLSYKPDIVCLTGDYVTGSILDFKSYKKVLSKLPSAAPTFACFGNHDGGFWAMEHGGYADTLMLEKLLSESEITYLKNKDQIINIKNNKLRIVGLADIWSGEMKTDNLFTKKWNKISIPSIVLLHNPDGKDFLSNYVWDLMLCGHTHGGQLKIPFWGAPYVPNVVDQQYVEGMHTYCGKWLHITRGVGNLWGIRLNCRPQVSVIRII